MKSRQSGKKSPAGLISRRHKALSQRASGRHPVDTSLRLRRILVPVDFSDCSAKALQYAISLAHASGAAITLLHVVRPVYQVAGEIDCAQVEASMKAGAAKKLAEM